MKGKAIAAALLAALLLFGYNGVAQAAPVRKVTARAACVLEQTSRRVLFEQNAHERLPMASCTKIMTALVALEHGKLTDTVKVSARAAGVEGSSIYLKQGEELTLEDLLYGLMLASGNDASIAIAEHIGGSVDGFLAMMNERAREIGALDTHFATPNGLDTEGHYTTAYDLALIAACAMDNSDFCRIVGTQNRSMPYDGVANGRVVRNKNKLLRTYEGANGVKTGYTGDAGRCFVGAARREGMQLIGVVLRCGPMFEETAALLDNAFAEYDMLPVTVADQAFGRVATDEGVESTVDYGAAREVLLPLTKEEQERIVLQLALWEPAATPITAGQAVGEARALLDGKTLSQFPLVALGDVERRNYFWYIQRVIEGMRWKTNGEESGSRSIWPLTG